MTAAAPMRAPGRARGSLTATEIVDVADRLVRVHGLQGFSMRKLATELGVNPMTIYLRFDNKSDLLAAVAERALAASAAGLGDLASADAPWVDRVALLGHAIRNTLIEARHVMPLFDDRTALANTMVEATNAGLKMMVEAGLDGPEAVEATRALFWTAVGSAMAFPSISAKPGQDLGSMVDARAGDTTNVATLRSMLHHFATVEPAELFDYTVRNLASGIAAGAASTEGPS